MGLLQNISILSAEPIRNMGGAAVQCIIRSSYNRPEQQMNRYVSFANMDNKGGVPNGYAPPYQIVIPLKGGGMATQGINATSSVGIVSLSLGKALASSLVGSGRINILSILSELAHLLSDLDGSGEIFSSNIVGLAILDSDLDGSGEIDITSAVKLLYYCLAELEGNGLISSAEQGAISGLATDLIIGSGKIDEISVLNLLSFLSSDTLGFGEISSSNIIGLSNFLSDISGSGLIDILTSLGLLSGISSSISGSGTVDTSSDFRAYLQMISETYGSGTVDIEINPTLLSYCLSSISGSGTVDITSDFRSYAQFMSELSGEGKINILSQLTGLLWFVTNIFCETDVEAQFRGDSYFSSEITTTGDVVTAQSCAQAVWNAIATNLNESGTMGYKLNSASAAGDPWTAELPGDYAEGTAGELLHSLSELLDQMNTNIDNLPDNIFDTNLENTVNIKNALKIMLSVLSGKTTKSGNTIKFRDISDTKDRVSVTLNDNKERINVSMDLS